MKVLLLSLIALLPLIVLLAADKPDAALVKTLRDKVASQDRTISDLSAQLDRSRFQADGRVQAMKAAGDSLNRTLQSQLDQARTETYTARTVSASKDVVIQELTAELRKTQSDTSTNAVAAAVQDTALKTAVKVASVRHAQDAADLKAGISLASVAAANSQQSAELSASNSKELLTATREIARLTGIIQENNFTEMWGWRLMAILGAVVLAQTIVTLLMFWQLYRIVRQESTLICPLPHSQP
jgi:hypothetical protein